MTDAWISTDDRLPEANQYVLVFLTGHSSTWGFGNLPRYFEVAQFMVGKVPTGEAGESIDPSRDQFGNNFRPYGWHGGVMTWVGQAVTHWMPLPDLPVPKTVSEPKDTRSLWNLVREAESLGVPRDSGETHEEYLSRVLQTLAARAADAEELADYRETP